MELAQKISQTPRPAEPVTFSFGPFRFYSGSLELLRGRRKVPLKVQSARVLRILLEGRGDLVGREAIIHEIWSDRVVEFDLSLNACIRDIRTALGDNAHDQHYIETLSKRGYRFNPKTPVVEKANGAPGKNPRPAVLAFGALAGLILLAVFHVYTQPSQTARISLATPEQNEAARALVLTGVAAIYDQEVPNYPNAIAAFSEAIAADPSYVEAHMMLARTVFARGEVVQISQAETSLAAILDLAPENLDALALRGSINWTIHHDWQAARADFERILKIDPDFSQAYIFLASYYSVMGDFTKSLEFINLALNLNTVRVSGNGTVGWIYYLAGRPREALSFCDETRAINPDGPNTRRCYLNNLITLGEVDQAAGHALAYLKIKGLPGDELARLEAAGAAAVLDYFTSFEAGVDIAENNRGDSTFLFKAIALTRLGDKTGAVETLEQAFQARNYFLPFIRIIPDLSPLNDQKAFQDLLQEMNFPPTYVAKS